MDNKAKIIVPTDEILWSIFRSKKSVLQDF